MSATGLAAIDHAVQLTNAWLRELMELLGWDDKQRAYRLLRATLQGLRDWLAVDEASNLGAQLPMLVRGIYYEGWHPAGTPIHPRKKEDFLVRIDAAFKTDPIDDVEEAVSAVFALLDRHVTWGEVDDIRQSLPKEMRELWPV
jgi:uncharacterized protein (DUF2267 family)